MYMYINTYHSTAVTVVTGKFMLFFVKGYDTRVLWLNKAILGYDRGYDMVVTGGDVMTWL
jgi:hypothetical protein